MTLEERKERLSKAIYEKYGARVYKIVEKDGDLIPYIRFGRCLTAMTKESELNPNKKYTGSFLKEKPTGHNPVDARDYSEGAAEYMGHIPIDHPGYYGR